MNSSPWRLEEVDGGDEQYPVESHFAVHHTLQMNRIPISTVALQHKSVSSILWYANPSRSTGPYFDRRRSNRSPFPPFCSTPDPSR